MADENAAVTTGVGPWNMQRSRKVLAYVTHRQRLLLFTQPRPGAGIQVPAGTLLTGESPEDGVLREAWEETGLEGLDLGAYLGRRDWLRDIPALGQPEMHERHFFHVLCTTEPPEAWQHVECDPSDGSSPIPFDFFWARLPHGVPGLVADQDALLPRLFSILNLSC